MLRWPMAMTNAHVAAQAALGIMPQRLRVCMDAPDIAAACASLDAFKAEVKTRYRKLVRELHPDLVGDCPVKAHALRMLIEVWEAFKAMKIIPKPQPAFSVVRIVVNVGNTTSWTNTSTTGW